MELPKAQARTDKGHLAGLSITHIAALDRLIELEKLAESYEGAHAQLAADCVAMIHVRRQLQSEGRLRMLPEPSQGAADRSYLDAAVKLCDGLEAVLKKPENAGEPKRTKILELWLRAGK